MKSSRFFWPDGSLNVSRETLYELESFAALVKKWNPAVNLVSKSTVVDIWDRHILDSAQLIDFCPPSAAVWVDIGSGGGFPGIVVAIIAKGAFPELRVCLVESDQRKCAFLAEAVRSSNLEARIVLDRAETMAPITADIVSARALAPLDKLIGLSVRHLSANGQCLFLKGASHKEELAAAHQSWRFDCDVFESRQSGNGAVLRVSGVSHAEEI